MREKGFVFPLIVVVILLIFIALGGFLYFYLNKTTKVSPNYSQALTETTLNQKASSSPKVQLPKTDQTNALNNQHAGSKYFLPNVLTYSQKSGWQTIKEQTNKWILDVKDEWKMKEVGGPGLYFNDKKPLTPDFMSLSIYDRTDAYPRRGLDAYYLEELQRYHIGLLDIQDHVINGNKAIFIIASTANPPGSIIISSIIEKNGRLFEIIFGMPEKMYLANKEDFQNFFASFR